MINIFKRYLFIYFHTLISKSLKVYIAICPNETLVVFHTSTFILSLKPLRYHLQRTYDPSTEQFHVRNLISVNPK